MVTRSPAARATQSTVSARLPQSSTQTPNEADTSSAVHGLTHTTSASSVSTAGPVTGSTQGPPGGPAHTTAQAAEQVADVEASRNEDVPSHSPGLPSDPSSTPGSASTYRGGPPPGDGDGGTGGGGGGGGGSISIQNGE